jgi:hypothetical protein
MSSHISVDETEPTPSTAYLGGGWMTGMDGYAFGHFEMCLRQMVLERFHCFKRKILKRNMILEIWLQHVIVTSESLMSL